MKNNFNLRTFLTENKLTSNSKLVKEADFAPAPNSDVMDANGEDFNVATAFKKARVDMSKPVSVRYMSGHAQYATVKVNEMSAEDAIKKIEAERQENQKNYTDDGEEVPSDLHGYEFDNYTTFEEDLPEGHEYKLSYYLGGDYTYVITQEKSEVSEKNGDTDEALDSLIAEDSKTMGMRDLAPHYIAAAKAAGFSDEQTKKAFGLVKRFMDKRAKGRRVKFINYGWAGYEDLYRKLVDILNKADGDGWEVKNDGSWYGDGSGWQVVKTYPFDSVSEKKVNEQPGTSAEDALAAVLDI